MRFIEGFNPEKIKKGADGKIPVVVQDALSGAVLSLAHYGADEIGKCVAEGRMKDGAVIEDARADCGSAALLVKVRQDKPACHTGAFSCFDKSVIDAADKKSFSQKAAILQEVYEVILERKRVRPENSYVAKKMDEGIDRILKKVGEEAGEVIIAAKNADGKEIGWEIADLIFHLWLVLAFYDLSPDIVYDKLMERRK